jgi:DNA-binding protein HU-beta
MMNKKKLAKRIASKTLLTQKESYQVLEATIESIIEGLEEDGEVSIVGFGKYYLYTHAPRPVRNPKTQEKMVLDAYQSVKFKVSDKIKKYFKSRKK